MASDHVQDSQRIAVVGLAGRFPGAPDLAAFWRNLRAGAESITFYSDDELRRLNVDPAWLNNPSFVRARPYLEGRELFDAGFFGYSAQEAEIIDPQQRLFLETSWEALEHAGYAPDAIRRPDRRLRGLEPEHLPVVQPARAARGSSSATACCARSSPTAPTTSRRARRTS